MELNEIIVANTISPLCFRLLEREVPERVNPSPSPTLSARESEWAKAEFVLHAATRCSRETELIRGKLLEREFTPLEQLFGFSSSLFHLCPKDQALVLLQFKNMFTITPYVSYCFYKTTYQNIESYPKMVTWNTSTDCCSWAGLQGKFHPNNSLFQLSTLKRLDLSRNDFSQLHISPKFSDLSSLRHLDLSDSNMSSPIPSEISHLSKLEGLAYWNKVRSLTLQQFAKCVWRRSSFKFFYYTRLNHERTQQDSNYLCEDSIMYSKIQVVTHHYQIFSNSQYLLLMQVQAQQKYLNALTQRMIP
ncbi:hypothetical protein H5410_003881 [Solanum commersonii]|uniref:Leucine-rich repeat-containing N-terminal plant-type domain-containing protein n=1 Tax=Solanum commersonii TaxID=4109 RepID=A0A9J6B6H2_SOLCO|nr:hypothetical protein H5410_003881 [Solanum commersonii]